ncbi:peptidase M1 [Christiangramia fulva]|uniref:Peptidase M1 n=1 Tax=Christiangramia fulva TaxID=2126553 RepID=A0A2R3Z6G4_9FLAO|nr:M1 family metallopeptidase [Christiangramia fulva]AVR45802.1 peptidase M1 [Christiangramia fulva]
MKNLILSFLLITGSFSSFAQVVGENNTEFTRADTLRGSLRPERTNYDVKSYHLKLKVEPEKKFISGSNIIAFEVLNDMPVMQLDLFDNMKIDSIVYKNKNLDYRREFNAVFINFPEALQKGLKDSLQFYYHGHPKEALHAPWDGGFVWTEDDEGNPWVGVAVQGTGASLWYPNKDHQSDEPEEAQMDISVPNGLMDVSNGRFLGKTDLGNGFTEWRWKVVNPINNYDIMINVGNYVHFSDKYKDLDLDYYVLPYNLEKAKKQFEEVKDMMACFYEKMGPYPFPEDGYKLVEAPYLGMEHQSAVAYGNHYQNGYLGRDLSGTGIGLKWDFIIIHESGHEWFGNSITAKDIADMWIHEGFTSYTEAIYVECEWGKEEALEYLQGLRGNIANDVPIIGKYGVNSEGSGDMYYKGSNLLNTIRSIYDDDELWWNTLKDYTKTFRHQTVSTKQVEDFFNKPIETDLKPIFDQYLRHSSIPELQLKEENDQIWYRWKAEVKDFSMPVDVFIDGKEKRLRATSNWQKINSEEDDLGDIRVNKKEFYVDVRKM